MKGLGLALTSKYHKKKSTFKRQIFKSFLDLQSEFKYFNFEIWPFHRVIGVRSSSLPNYFLVKFFRIGFLYPSYNFWEVKIENLKILLPLLATCRKNLSQFGHPHPSLLQLAHSPTSNFDTILMTFLGWFGDDFEKILRQFWVDVGSILRRILGRFRDNFGDNFGTILGAILGRFSLS